MDKSLPNFKKLKKRFDCFVVLLTLRGSKYKSLDKAIKKQKGSEKDKAKVKTIDFSSQGIEKVSKDFGKGFLLLESFVGPENRIKEFPVGLVTNCFETLTCVQLDGNMIKTIPPSIKNLCSLKSLSCINNNKQTSQ